jgi:hypothetical protein
MKTPATLTQRQKNNAIKFIEAIVWNSNGRQRIVRQTTTAGTTATTGSGLAGGISACLVHVNCYIFHLTGVKK